MSFIVFTSKNNPAFALCRSLLIVFLLLVSTQALNRGRPTVTIVTALYDIGSGQGLFGLRRSYTEYLHLFQKLLQTPSNLIIFGNKALGQFVKDNRNRSNTLFIQKQLSWFGRQWWKPLTERVVKNLKNNEVVWQDYKRLPQYATEYYFPLTVSKAFLLEQAMKKDVFHSDYLLWLDAGLMHRYGLSVQKNIHVPQNVLEKMMLMSQQPWFFNVSPQDNLFRGYGQAELRYVHTPINQNNTVLSNYFGGGTYMVRDYRCVFQNLLRITLQNGDMNSDSTVMTLMVYRYPYLVPICNQIDARMLIDDINIAIPHHLTPNTARNYNATMKENKLQDEQPLCQQYPLLGNQQEQEYNREAQQLRSHSLRVRALIKSIVLLCVMGGFVVYIQLSLCGLKEQGGIANNE